MRWPLLVIGVWVALAVVLSMTCPSLDDMIEEHPVAFLPTNSPVSVTTNQMTEAFHDKGTDNILLVVLTDEKGLGRADEGVYRTLVDNLHKDTRHVVMLQDFLSTPPLRDVMTSKDGKAWMLPVGLAGELRTAQSYVAYKRVARLVKQTFSQKPAGSTLTANLTGPAATVVDLTDIGWLDQENIELALTIMLATILMIVYRNPVTMMLPLITIGASLVTAQAIVAGLAQLGVGVSPQTIVFLSGMMSGAGTDYAVFLISRYHDYVRLGADSDQAVKKALASIGKVIAASAATVAVTFLGMVFARLGVFSSVGVALSVAIGVAFLAAVTLLPAILVLTGRRGWIKPRRDRTTRFWRRSGIRIVRRPKIHLVASLLVLILLASCASLARYNYDDRKTLPRRVESGIGYIAMDRHFPINESIPQYLVIQSPHDLRTPTALADLEQMAQRISQLPGVAMVRGITRPTGQSPEEARATFQAGMVGDKLHDASGAITDHTGDLTTLTKGANQLADSLGDIRGGMMQAIGNVGGLVDLLAYLQNQFGGEKTLKDIDTAAKLVTSMRSLGDALGVNLSDVAGASDWAGPLLTALDASPICAADPSCQDSRSQLQRLVTAQQDGTFDKVIGLARQLQSTQGTQTLGSAAQALREALNTATDAMRSLGGGDPGGIRGRLAELRQGAEQLAEGSRQLANGVKELVEQTKKMGVGLNEASGFLLAMKYDASKPSMSGFYIPPQVLTRDDFKEAASAFVSPDGHTVRYLVQTDLNPFSTQAMDQVNSITRTARGAEPNTELAGASMSIAGYTATLRDMRDYYNHDIRFIIVVTVMVVLLILIALLRALVAPLYLIGSVVISYLAALGIGVIVFQGVLGQQLHWSLPGLTFIILVAVGADYNMLLISRIRDESPHGIRSGVIRTVGSTGGVITAAGLIFAASMFGLLFASISTVIQCGFVVGIGILMDTFVVRTITVPAIAVLVGRANWWPSRLWPRRPRSSTGGQSRVATPRRRTAGPSPAPTSSPTHQPRSKPPQLVAQRKIPASPRIRPLSAANAVTCSKRPCNNNWKGRKNAQHIQVRQTGSWGARGRVGGFRIDRLRFQGWWAKAHERTEPELRKLERTVRGP
ncbi:MAG: MMPL family RND transporter [Mycobacterium sp.]|uniref:MMPL family RND transporter n=1 Tax=Mycobacterium sp. TaxID=1785 RepID=UPI003CC6B8E0